MSGADGVSDAYAAKELRWKNAASGVRQIISQLRKALGESDQVAQSAISKAKSAVANIG